MDAQTLELRWRTTLGASLAEMPGADETTGTFRPLVPAPGVETTVVERPPAPGETAGPATTVVPAAAPAPAPAPLAPTLAHFEPVSELARGGMGVVFRARQRTLDREVAVKRILETGTPAEDAQRRSRFVAEALVTGQLAHPHIVPVHELGRTDAGELFLAMKLVSGVSWRDRLRAARAAGTLDLRAELGTLVAVAHAVAFAHSRSVLHRDLKPANVMLGEFGEVLLMDWGLAAAFGEREPGSPFPHAADSTSPLGSPAYMPPELAEGRGADQGPWTDVYLLGATLHEVLTGEPPHRGRSFLEVLVAASESRPPAFPGSVPDELGRICARALSREPRDRHPSVAALQGEVLGFLEHEGSLLISNEAQRALARAAAPDADATRVYAELSEAIAGFRQARTLWAGNEAAREGERRARTALAAAALRQGDLALAEAQARELGGSGKPFLDDVARARAHATRARRTLRALRAALVLATAILVLGLAATLHERDRQYRAEHAANLAAQLRSVEAKLAGAERRALEVGPRLDARPEEGEGLVREVAFVASELAMYRDEAEALAPAFPDVGAALAAANRTSELAFARTLDELSTRYPRRFGNRAPVFAVAYSADGRSLAAAGRGDALLYDLSAGPTSGRPRLALDDLAGDVGSLALSPDGTRLVAGLHEGAAALFDLPSGGFRCWLPHDAGVDSVAFSPDSRRIATAARDGTVRLWDAATGEPGRVIAAGRFVHRAAFTADGSGLVSVAALSSNAVALRDAATGEVRRTFEGLDDPALDGALCPATGELLGVARSGALVVWDVATGARKASLEGGARPGFEACAFAPDGRSFVTVQEGGVLRSWDRASLAVRWERAGVGSSAAISPDGREVAVGLVEGVLLRLDAATGEVLAASDVHPPLGASPALTALAVAPGEREAATGGSDGAVRVWELEQGKLVASLRDAPGPVRALAWGPGGAELLAASDDGTVRLWDRATGRLLRRFDGCRGETGEGPRALAVSPDGRRFAVAHGTTASVRELPSGQLVKVVGEHGKAVDSVAYEPDGELVTSGADGFRGFAAGSLAPIFKSELASGGTALVPGGDLVLDVEDTRLQFFDRRTGARPRYINAGARASQVAVSPEGHSFLALLPDSSFAVWTPEASRRPWVRRGFSGKAVAAAFVARGDVLLAFESGALERWRRPPALGENPPASERPTPISACVSPDGTRALVSHDGKLVLRDVATGRALRTLATWTERTFVAPVFTPDGRGAVAAFADLDTRGARVLAWDDAAVAPVTTLATWERQHALVLACSPDGTRVLAGFFGGELRALERRTGRLLFEATDEHAPVVWIGCSPDGRAVHAVWKTGRLETRDAVTGALARRLQLRPGEPRACALSPDGRELVVGYDDIVRVHDVATGAEKLPALGGPAGSLGFVAYASDREIATASTGPDGPALRFWDRETHQAVRWPEAQALAALATPRDPRAPFVVVTRRGAIQRLDRGLAPSDLDPELARDPIHVVGRLTRRVEARGWLEAPSLDAFAGLVAPGAAAAPPLDVGSPEAEERRGTALLLSVSERGLGARAGLAWLRSAAARGSTRAMNRLAWALERGLGAHDPAEAKRLRAAAAKAGDLLAAGDVPGGAARGDPLALVLAAVGARDAAALDAAASRGEPDALAALAELAPARSGTLLARGASLGDPPLLRKRGESLLPWDLAAALDDLERAGKAGDRASWEVLARVWSEGTVAARDPKRAEAARRRAAAAQEDDE